MGRLGLTAICSLLIAVLLFGGSGGEGQNTDPSVSQLQQEPVELTDSKTTASFAVSPDTVASAPPVLALSFPHVVNPSNTPFVIFASLSYRPEQGKDASPRKILLGNGSLYPADRPGGLRLRTSTAFAKLKAAKAADVRLVLELKRLRPAEPWSQVEITVAPPEWRSENSL